MAIENETLKQNAIARLRANYGTGDIPNNPVWQFFEPILERIIEPNTNIEIEHFKDSDSSLHVLENRNCMVAFVIDRRDAFNNHEFTFCEVEEKLLGESYKRKAPLVEIINGK